MPVRNEIHFRAIAMHLIEQSELLEIKETGEKLKAIIDEIVEDEIKYCQPDLKDIDKQQKVGD